MTTPLFPASGRLAAASPASIRLLGAILAFNAVVLVPLTRAQSTGAAASAAEADDTVLLSEFQVSTNADKGYRAGNSVSASRVDTPIKDLPFAVSAFTSQFI